MLPRMMAVARAELRFGFRRGWPVVGTVAVVLVVSAFALYVGYMNTQDMPQGIPQEVFREYAATVGALALAGAWPVFEWLALVILPIVTAQAIPSDRQLGVDEILRSQPLTGGTYLAGKVLGMLSAVLLTGGIIGMVHVLLHFLLVGPIHSPFYLEMTLLSALPLLIWASAIGVLAGCFLRTRRAAILIGVVVGLAGPPSWSLAFRPPPDLPFYVPHLSLLSRQPASDFVLQQYGMLPSWVPPVTVEELVRSYVLALMILLVATIAARLWLFWKENI
jgi:ABC-type transport system involved in multi-copper enzyme maturation permease subunit